MIACHPDVRKRGFPLGCECAEPHPVHRGSPGGRLSDPERWLDAGGRPCLPAPSGHASRSAPPLSVGRWIAANHRAQAASPHPPAAMESVTGEISAIHPDVRGVRIHSPNGGSSSLAADRHHRQTQATRNRTPRNAKPRDRRRRSPPQSRRGSESTRTRDAGSARPALPGDSSTAATGYRDLPATVPGR